MLFLAIGLGLLSAVLVELAIDKWFYSENPLWAIATFFIVTGGVYVVFDRLLPAGG